MTAIPLELSLLDLPADLFEMWQERACIRHFDGKLSWKEAETEALADVFSVLTNRPGKE
jgi:hypothetical protein